MSDSKYSYERFGKKGQRVGQAVMDILSKEQPTYTVEDILEGMNEKFLEGFEECLRNGEKRYQNENFYIFVLTKKELSQFGVTNVLRNYFINRATEPNDVDMMVYYPHYVKSLYFIDPKKGDFQLKWSIPDSESCNSIIKNPQIYDPQLVKWVKNLLSKIENVPF